MNYAELETLVKNMGPGNVTEDEMARIATGGVIPLEGVGFLAILRAQPGLTPDDLLRAALSQPYNEEHHEMMRKARDYFMEHAAEFGLEF